MTHALSNKSELGRGVKPDRDPNEVMCNAMGRRARQFTPAVAAVSKHAVRSLAKHCQCWYDLKRRQPGRLSAQKEEGLITFVNLDLSFDCF